jgi:hypothetical protein
MEAGVGATRTPACKETLSAAPTPSLHRSQQAPSRPSTPSSMHGGDSTQPPFQPPLDARRWLA